jgi:arylsulfatase A-like enzyme/tetratricopeptide (TPR) repeat protein
MRRKPVFLFILMVTFSLLSQNGEIMPKSKGMGGSKFDIKNCNVLLITIDTLRYDRVGIYSQKYVKTPNIDKLALKSTLFLRAFSHNPVTLPAHVNILTGLSPLYHGISDNTGFRLGDNFLTMAEFFKNKSFETGAFIGAFPLDSRFGLNQGFDVYDDNYGTHNSLDFFFVERKADKVIELAMKWIGERDGKWFSWIHLFDPHQPYLPPKPYDQEYSNDLYSGEVAFVDNELGRLFDLLEKKKLMDNTIIVFTSDHGEALGEKGESTHAYFAYNNTILIPLFLYIPGGEAKKIKENVCHIDIFPTLCDLLNQDIPSHLQGESMLPIMKGKKRKNTRIYFESLSAYLNRGWAPLRGFLEGPNKFIDLPIKEFYNLDIDIHENDNLAKKINIGKHMRNLQTLMKALSGKEKSQRSTRIDSDSLKKLRSLGYMTGTPTTKKKVFTKEDDLKTLLPLNNKMLNAAADYNEGKIEQAKEKLASVIKESPQFIRAYGDLAKIHNDTGRAELAVEVLRQALRNNPKNQNIMSKLGIYLTEMNKNDEAIDILTQCIKGENIDPENYNYLGVAYYKKGNFKLALENYNKALEIDNNYASIFNNIGTLYLSDFLRRKDERSYDTALKNFFKALELDPKLSSAYNGRGAAYMFKGKVQEAIKDWQAAIAIKPDYADPYFSIGIAFLRIKDKPSALKYFNLCKEKCFYKLPVHDQQRLNRLINEASR